MKHKLWNVLFFFHKVKKSMEELLRKYFFLNCLQVLILLYKVESNIFLKGKLDFNGLKFTIYPYNIRNTEYTILLIFFTYGNISLKYF